MANRFNIKRLILLMSAAGTIALHQTAMAAAFQLWEQDGASIGNYHAGIAAEAADASTSFYNPAGLTRIKNQQFVIGGDPVITNFRYRGTIAVITLEDPNPQPTTAQGGGFNFVPFGHYAAPINDNLVFGVSIVIPFGLKTDYDVNSIVRYAATLTQVKVIDITPSLGLAFNDKISIGVGFDAERITADFNNYPTAGASDILFDSQSKNTGTGTAYGYHLGVLLSPTPDTRFGATYHSQVVHHLKGHSMLTGPLANSITGGTQYSGNLRANTTLPPTTSVSGFHTINNRWDVMGSVTYTQWSVFKNLILNNAAGINSEFMQTNNLQIIVAEHYHNSWNYSVGANYHATDQWMLRTGVGFDQTPSNNNYRNLQLPDSDRIAVALGTHYQATQTIGVDVGWTHIFAMNTRINNVQQPIGPEIVTTNGSVRSSADAFGLQLKWDII